LFDVSGLFFVCLALEHHLLLRMLHANPAMRISVTEALEHPYFKNDPTIRHSYLGTATYTPHSNLTMKKNPTTIPETHPQQVDTTVPITSETEIPPAIESSDNATSS
jgi:serine/threonine protein kinase